jgi:hypothetical protein
MLAVAVIMDSPGATLLVEAGRTPVAGSGSGAARTAQTLEAAPHQTTSPDCLGDSIVKNLK